MALCNDAEIDVEGTDDLEAENDLVISENDLVISENDAQNDESEDASQILNKEIEKARKILEEAKMQAESIIKEAESNAQLIIEEAQGSANEILDDAKDFLRIALESEEKYLYDYKRFVAEKKDEVSSFVIADRSSVKKSVVDTRLSMDEVKATLSGAQDSFKAVEAALSAISSTINEAVNGLTGTLNQVASDVEYKNTEYAWSQFSQIYDQLSATYNAYRYGNSDDFIPKFDVLNRLEMFMEIVELCLEDYALVPFETPVGEKYDIRKHKARVQGNNYDPRNSYVAKSVKKGFMWGDVVRVKEEVEICASIDSLIDDTQMLDNETDNSEE
jgi:cell division septum initiation protein DivIVA